MEQCKNCKNWDPKNSGDGICRKNAPKPVITEEGKKYSVVWPTTSGNEFCGEFKPSI